MKTNHYSNFDFDKAATLIKLALKEDIGDGDVTSNYLVPPRARSRAFLVFKDKGIIAGLKIFELVFKIIDSNVKIEFFVNDGDLLKYKKRIGIVEGNTRSILKGERVALNILQRMSGIATNVWKLKRKLQNNKIKILDTRKTTPNFRLFEKLAVAIGGGTNHRFGLYDMILVKDNHIEVCGGIENTLKQLSKIKHLTSLKIEVEVKNISELEIVKELGEGIVDIVMLDNFKIEDIKTAIKIINRKFRVELSGGISSINIQKYGKLKGIDFISSGAVTHTYKSLDIALDFFA
ncbi:MAG: carboxylating nicotinate-nucleotide diphosphorylase [Ignavibacteria bacterium]